MGKSDRDERKLPWLQPLWDRKRQETANRVAEAVKHLMNTDEPVTLERIRQTVRSLFRVSMSTNTIQMNQEAYSTYLRHRTHQPRMQPKSPALRAVQSSAATQRSAAIRARINRLRRDSKDTLIVYIMDLGNSVEQHVRREDNLREEILRLTLGCPRKGKDE